MKKIDRYVSEMTPLLKEWRRTFHSEPELGWTEFVTTFRVASLLRSFGWQVVIGEDALVPDARMGVPPGPMIQNEVERAKRQGIPPEELDKMRNGTTGLVASLDTGNTGPHFAMRFDIDALPVKESDIQQHIPHDEAFESERSGLMHACGHDGHIAIGIGIAKWIVDHLESLSGRFTLLFQPAEEGSRGAKSMVQKGWLDEVDFFMSGHIGIESLEVGAVAATSTTFLATTKFDVAFTGTAAHAGKNPENGANALLAAAVCAQQLHAIAPHSGGMSRINVGTLHAGSGRNVVADFAEITAETRGETSEINSYMMRRVHSIVAGCADMYDVKARITEVGTGGTAVCDQEFYDYLNQASSRTDRITTIKSSITLGASEDVTHMINRVQEKGGKATFLIFGTPLPVGHHHPLFDFDEEVLPTAVATYAALIDEITRECSNEGVAY